MVAGIALNDGELLILAATEADRRKFCSLEELEAWANLEATRIIHATYFHRNNSGTTIYQEFSAHPKVSEAASAAPVETFLQAMDDINIIEGVQTTLHDDSRTVSILAYGPDAPAHIRHALEWYAVNPGTPLREEQPGDLIAGPDGQTYVLGTNGELISLEPTDEDA